MAKKRKKKATPNEMHPTPEREARNQTQSMGMARRVKPMIDILRDAGKLSAEQYEKLSYYRDQASLAERSPLRSCLNRGMVGSSGNGPGVAITSAVLETARMERDMGWLWEVARAVAVDDKSISQWCVEKYGGRERYDKRGKFVAMVPVSERKNCALELMHLRYAAGYIVV